MNLAYPINPFIFIFHLLENRISGFYMTRHPSCHHAKATTQQIIAA